MPPTPILRTIPGPGEPYEAAYAFAWDYFPEPPLDSYGLSLEYVDGSWSAWNGKEWDGLKEDSLRSSIYAFLASSRYSSEELGWMRWAPNKARVDDVIDALKAIAHVDYYSDEPSL
jgi:hypothetical protein